MSGVLGKFTQRSLGCPAHGLCFPNKFIDSIETKHTLVGLLIFEWAVTPAWEFSHLFTGSVMLELEVCPSKKQKVLTT